VINLQYDTTADGESLKQRDEDSKVRALLRSKNLDVRNNCGFNLINGSDRLAIEIPINQKYFPPERALQSVGAAIMGTDYAGKPLRKDLYYTPQKVAGKFDQHTLSMNQLPPAQQPEFRLNDRSASVSPMPIYYHSRTENASPIKETKPQTWSPQQPHRAPTPYQENPYQLPLAQ